MGTVQDRKKAKTTPEGIQDLPVSIVLSKLYPPPMAPDTILRERLLQLAPTVSCNPATLVSAPAGYGKSTLVSHWLQQMECKSAWLSLDSTESDFTQFLSYVVAALRGAYPGRFVRTAEILQSAILPDVGIAAALFSNDADQIGESFVLVLDDYYRISSPEVDAFIDAVLKRPPINLHLVIVSRHDPGLSLHAFRASGTLTEVRLQQLAFREEESRTFIQGSLGNTITDNEISRLHERIEGWPAALRLAILAATGSNTATDLIDHLPADSHAVRTYLMEEVLAGQSSEMRECLLRVAFLDRFCEDLCDAIITKGTTGISGREFVSRASQAGLFTIALDARQEWFRFHHLFQAILQDQAIAVLGNKAMLNVHMRACAWFERHGYLDEAIRHALHANDTDEAASVLVRNRTAIMNREQWHQLGSWLQLLSPQIVESQAELLLLKGRFLRTTGRNVDLVHLLDNAEALLGTAEMDDTLKQELLGSLASMRCYQLYMMSDGKGAARTARLACELLPKEDLSERGSAMIIISAALQMTGDIKQAKSTSYAALSDASATAGTGATYTTRLLTALNFVHWMDADLHALKKTAKDTEEMSAQSGLWEVLSVALHFKAAIHYHWNELSEVEEDLRQLFSRKAISSPEFYALNLIISGLTYEVLGDSEKALHVGELLHDLAFRTHNTYLAEMTEAYNAELAMRQGNTAKALKWAGAYNPEPLMPMYAFFSPPMCLAKILVLDDCADSHKRAEALLGKLEEYLTGIHNITFLIETLALQAVLSEKSGHSALAAQQLGRAVSLAQSGGFIRVFVDIGPDLIPLLNRLDLKGNKLQYVGRILAAFQPAGDPKDLSLSDAKTGVVIRDVPGMPAPLSPREKDVLVLLLERLTNKEIGERLFIAPATVKRHAQTIYEKLNVKGRREAVTKAIGLGLITHPSSPPLIIRRND
jgi:ATP/maltotriose-dependent transcriptional regulator MalT